MYIAKLYVVSVFNIAVVETRLHCNLPSNISSNQYHKLNEVQRRRETTDATDTALHHLEFHKRAHTQTSRDYTRMYITSKIR